MSADDGFAAVSETHDLPLEPQAPTPDVDEAPPPTVGETRPATTSDGDVLMLRGRRIALRRWGSARADAPTAIFIHGALSHSGRWTRLAAAVAETYACVALDLPGYGRSDPAPSDPLPIHLHDAAAVDAVAHDIDSPVILIGEGAGAEAAAIAAARRSSRVEGLVLIEPPAFALLEEAEDPRRLEALDLSLGVLAHAGFGDPDGAARLWVDYVDGPGAFDALSDEDRAYASASTARLAAERLAASGAAPGTLGYADYRELPTRTLLVCRENAPAAIRAAVARVRRAAAGAKSAVIRGQGDAGRGGADAAILSFLTET